jgi:hypothetical protein
MELMYRLKSVTYCYDTEYTPLLLYAVISIQDLVYFKAHII